MSLLSRLLLTIVTLTSCVTMSFAQGQTPVGKDLTVTVKVTDKTGAMPGASVLVKGTTNGQITGPDGTATLSNVPADATLVISFVGYQDVELQVNGKTSLNALLKDDSLALNEIVVVGYGTQKKANLTGAVDQVGAETFEGRANANITQMLQGQVPNLNLKFTDGRPNSSPSYNIRGTTSIGQGGSALVLIDGVEGSLNSINPQDVESVSVLKDASSTAVYGARGAFGVILVTTKNPQKGRPVINYNGSVTVNRRTVVPDVITDGQDCKL